MPRRPLAFIALLLALAPRVAAASFDTWCEATWMLEHRELSGCDDMALLQPGNDTRVNLLLLTLDRRGKPIALPAVEASGDGTPDPFAEWPAFARRLSTPPPSSESEDDQRDYADGEGSRCRTNASGAAAFVEQVRVATDVPEPERVTLIAVREGLKPDCAADPKGGAAIAEALKTVQSPLGKSFGAYLQGAQAFYDGDYDAAKAHFSSLTSVKQPWLAETSRYMLGRVEVNRAQIGAFDEYGYPTGKPADPQVIDAAETAFRDYLSAYPQGAYAASARGLLRRVYWLGKRTKPLADAYVALLATDGASSPGGPDDVALLDEIDDKLLMASGFVPPNDPTLLAVEDLRRMRDPDKPIRREEIEAQRPSFASNPALFEYLLAAHDFYVRNEPQAVLAAIPAATPNAPLGPVEFSRQMLRGMALEARKDPGAREHWVALLPAAVQPLQRPAVELALALHDERTGAVEKAFAADSPITNVTIRETLLRKIAGADLLRRQAQNAALPQHERDVALYVLLYKEVTRGRYDDFLRDLALVPADAPTDGAAGNLGIDEKPALGVFTQTTVLGDYDCAPLKETAALLAKNPTSPKGLLCLADFMRANGFDQTTLDVQPRKPELGSTTSQFAGKPFSRLEIYEALIANPKTPAADRAYALFRAVRCYAPAQINACGGEDVPLKQRKAWFQQLKKQYPSSKWAKELQHYW